MQLNTHQIALELTKTNVPAMRTFQEHYPARLSLVATTYSPTQCSFITSHHTQEHLVNVSSDVTVIRRITAVGRRAALGTGIRGVIRRITLIYS